MARWSDSSRRSRRNRRFTRSQRKMIYGVLFAVLFVVLASLVWAPRRYSWVSVGGAPGLGSDSRVFGMLSYLEVRRTNVTQNGAPTATTKTSFTWRPLGVVTSALGTLFYAIVAVLTVHRVVQHEKLPIGRCDGCGYDLQGLPLESQQCPECGEAIDEAGRRR